MKPPIKLLQERDFGQKINATFEFVGQNFKPLMTCMLYIAGPAAVVAGIAQGIYQSNLFSTLGAVKSSNSPLINNPFLSVLTPTYFVLFFFLVIASIVATLTVYFYVLEYEKRGNVPTITPNEIWPQVRSSFLKYLGYGLLAGFLIIIATLFLVIPGIYVAIVLSLLMFVILRENTGFQEGISRCFYLIKDKWWSTFGLLLIVGLIQSIINYVFQIPQFIFGILTGLEAIKGDISTFVSAISGVVGTVGSVLTSCLISLATIFQYYNLVERRDGTGIVDAIQSIGTKDTPRTDLREEQY